MTFLPPCTGCGRPQVPHRTKGRVPAGYARHNAHGLCVTCYLRDGKPEETATPRRSTRPAFHAVSVDYRLGNGQVITLPAERVVLRTESSPDDGIIDSIAVWRGWKDAVAPRLTAREVLCVVAELATRGWLYVEIGERLGITGDGVRSMVLRFGLPRPPKRKYGDEYLWELIALPYKRVKASPDALRLAGVRTA